MTLAEFPIFVAWPADSIAALSATVTRRGWTAGAMIFRRGDAGDHLLAIRSGRVRLSLASPQGREVVLSAIGPGSILGEMALIDGLPRSADARALQDTDCLALSRAGFHAVAQRHPDVALALAQHLCAMLRRTDHQLESIAIHDLRARTSGADCPVLPVSARTGTRAAHPPAPVLRHGLNRSDQSAILGASRPKVNQALQTPITLGTLRSEGAGLVCDLPMLRALAEAG